MRNVTTAALLLFLGCDAPHESPMTPRDAPPDDAVASDWVQDDGVGGCSTCSDFVPDSLFPFHIYWHGETVPTRIKSAVRAAATRWATIVAPTEVLPYVYEQHLNCSDPQGVANLSFSRGDTIAGGFHLYVTGDNNIGTLAIGMAFGPCTHQSVRGGWRLPSNHPVTNAPPNGMMWINPRIADYFSEDQLEEIALHEIGHLLGIGFWIGERWTWNLRSDTTSSGWRYFYQADTLAVNQYVDWVTHTIDGIAVDTLTGDTTVTYRRPYPGNKMPLDDYSHWSLCLLSGSFKRSITRGRSVGDIMSRTAWPLDESTITRVTAAMLQGFKVNWSQFPEDDLDEPGDLDPWAPDEWTWQACPEMWGDVSPTVMVTDDTHEKYSLRGDVRPMLIREGAGRRP